MIGHLAAESHITGGRPKFRAIDADGVHVASLQADGTVISAGGQVVVVPPPCCCGPCCCVPGGERLIIHYYSSNCATFLIWQVLAYIEPDGTVGGPDMS